MSVLDALRLAQPTYMPRPQASVRTRPATIGMPNPDKPRRVVTRGTVGMLEDDFRQLPMSLMPEMPQFTPTAGRGARPQLSVSQKPYTVPLPPIMQDKAEPSKGFAGLLGGLDDPTIAGLGAAGASLLQSTGYSAVPRTTGQVLGEAFEAFNAARQQTRQQDIQNELLMAKMNKKSAFAQKMADLGIDLSTPEGRKKAIELEKSGGTTIQLGEKAASEYALDRMKKFADKADKSQSLVSAYDFISRTLQDPEIDTGVVTQAIQPFMQALAGAGFLTEEEAAKVSNIEALNAKMLEIVPKMRPEGSGSTSNFEFANYIKASPSLSKTKEGNMIIAAVAKQSAERKMLEHKEREAYFDKTNRIIPSDELAKVVDEKYGTMFKTPFGSISALEDKTVDEIDAEMDKMIVGGKIKAGDVVFVGSSLNKKLKDAGLPPLSVGGYIIMSQEAINSAMGAN